MRRLNVALETLHSEWVDRLAANSYVGQYPQKAASLQYHFAKLFVGSYAFRNLKSDPSGAWLLGEDIDLQEQSKMAILSATTILRTVVCDTELNSQLRGFPVYFHTMITFAAIFLLKLSTRCSSTALQLDTEGIQCLLMDLMATLKRATSTMHTQHPLVNITKGIENVLGKSGIFARRGPDETSEIGDGWDPTWVRNPAQDDFSFLEDEMFDQIWTVDYAGI